MVCILLHDRFVIISGFLISMNIYSLREKEMKLQDSFNVFIPYGDGFVCCCDFYGYIFLREKELKLQDSFNVFIP